MKHVQHFCQHSCSCALTPSGLPHTACALHHFFQELVQLDPYHTVLSGLSAAVVACCGLTQQPVH
jgi:hypothetical protein